MQKPPKLINLPLKKITTSKFDEYISRKNNKNYDVKLNQMHFNYLYIYIKKSNNINVKL